jgi:hypothetical protein
LAYGVANVEVGNGVLTRRRAHRLSPSRIVHQRLHRLR